jgi:predicted nuclease with TOPRIM domain
MSDYSLDQGLETISKLEELCSQSANEVLIAQTKLEELQKRKTSLINECETKTGLKFDEIQNYIDEKQKEFDSIMDKINDINITDIDNLTDEQIEKIMKLSF